VLLVGLRRLRGLRGEVRAERTVASGSGQGGAPPHPPPPTPPPRVRRRRRRRTGGSGELPRPHPELADRGVERAALRPVQRAQARSLDLAHASRSDVLRALVRGLVRCASRISRVLSDCSRAHVAAERGVAAHRRAQRRSDAPSGSATKHRTETDAIVLPSSPLSQRRPTPRRTPPPAPPRPAPPHAAGAAPAAADEEERLLGQSPRPSRARQNTCARQTTRQEE